MFPKELEELGELAKLDSDSLKILALRYRRLAELCESRERWLREWAEDKDQKRLAFDDEFHKLKVKIKRLWIHGRKADAIVSECSNWDEAVVRYWVKVTAKDARQAKGPEHGPGPFEVSRRRSKAATGLSSV